MHTSSIAANLGELVAGNTTPFNYWKFENKYLVGTVASENVRRTESFAPELMFVVSNVADERLDD